MSRITTSDLSIMLNLHRSNAYRQVVAWFDGDGPFFPEDEVFLVRGNRRYVALTPAASRAFIKWYRGQKKGKTK